MLLIVPVLSLMSFFVKFVALTYTWALNNIYYLTFGPWTLVITLLIVILHDCIKYIWIRFILLSQWPLPVVICVYSYLDKDCSVFMYKIILVSIVSLFIRHVCAQVILDQLGASDLEKETIIDIMYYDNSLFVLCLTSKKMNV